MPLWWARREQLDNEQIDLIEHLPLRESHLILGPPGSGKTNVLLRRAQFARSQGMPNVLVLSFTRALTEFVRTGCYDVGGREIFPPSAVNTLEGWLRGMYRDHGTQPPSDIADFEERKAALATGAMAFAPNAHLPQYDTLFVDEAQDLMPEEAELLSRWSRVLFFVGDDRQRIYSHSKGLSAVRAISPPPAEHELTFHYRVAPELCEMADRILVQDGRTLASTSHYDGPRPGRIEVTGPMQESAQLESAAERLTAQMRAYADLLQQGDLLGVVVARRDDRQLAHEFFERHPDLNGKSKIIKARDEDEDYDPSFNPDKPIVILTVKGCKGLEFRSLHWLFCEKLDYFHDKEHYYTVVTRAKTSLDLYYASNLPEVLARSYASPSAGIW